MLEQSEDFCNRLHVGRQKFMNVKLKRFHKKALLETYSDLRTSMADRLKAILKKLR